MKYKVLFLSFFAGSLALTSCNNSDKSKEPEMKTQKLREDNVTYSADSVTMNGYVVYDENVEGPRPAVIVIPEWWGLNEYARKRARDLAGLGYIAMAMDMYGDGKQADNPDSAGKLATPFYSNPAKAQMRFHAALEKLKSYAQADKSKTGVIGYCFGGAQAINMAKLGEDLKGVVSFHGNLTVVPVKKELLKAEILVCHGAADQFVPQAEVDRFKKEMDSAGAKYEFHAYEGALHAFTNPEATETGKRLNIPVKYDAAADSASWNHMRGFFERVFK